jgi:hypothetical protein
MDLENHILEKYNIKLYNEDYSICDIINDFLNNNQNEQPFYIIDIGEIIKSYSEIKLNTRNSIFSYLENWVE